MAWRVARSLDVLLAQINAAHPRRSKISDGSIGNTAHSSRVSDHNPDPSGVVRARDFTHDPSAGFDAGAFANRILRAQDPRLKYVISNGHIGSGRLGIQPGVWRPYYGPNAHTLHVHVSVVPFAAADATYPWTGVTSGLSGSNIPNLPQPSPTPEDDMSVADVRTGLYELIDEAANRSTATGRQFGDDLNTIIGERIRVAVHGLLDEAANRGTPTGRQVADDLRDVLATDPAVLAQQIAYAMPASSSTVAAADLAVALRTVLGSLDNPKET